MGRGGALEVHSGWEVGGHDCSESVARSRAPLFFFWRDAASGLGRKRLLRLSSESVLSLFELDLPFFP